MIGWAVYYLFLATFLITIESHLVWRNWDYLRHYRVTKWMTGLLVPLLTFNAILFYWEAIRIFQARPELFAYHALIIQIFSLIFLFVLSFLFILLLYYCGMNWINRRIYGRKQNFGPYLVFGKDPSSNMIIAWGKTKKSFMNNKPITNKLFLFGETPEKLQPSESALQENDLIFFIELNKLKPNSQYFYQIPSKTNVYSFRTAPNTNIEPEFEFIVLSDLHGSGKPIGNTVKLISKFPNSRFIISGGDNVSDGRLNIHWRTLFGQLEPISPYLPFMSVTGNHDAELPKSAKNFRQIFQNPYVKETEGLHYKFIFQNTAFFMMDSYNAGKERRVPFKLQIEWLEQELINLPKDISHRFLVMHNSIYTTGDFGCDPDLGQLYLGIIDKYHIQIVFSGHSHIFEVFFRPDLNLPNGTAFIVTGGGGGRNDYNVIRWFADTPYKWDSTIHIAKKHAFLRGEKNNRFRNDQAVLKYQEIGKLTHEIVHVHIKGSHLEMKCIEWDGTELYSKLF